MGLSHRLGHRHRFWNIHCRVAELYNRATFIHTMLSVPLLVSLQVKKEAINHLTALETFKHIVEAAAGSATQYRSIREALRKARVQENQAAEREKKRKEKEAETERKKAAAAEARAKKKAAEKAAKAARAAEEAEDDDDEAGADAGPRKKKARRGRGVDEIGESDFPVIANRFTDFEMPVVSTHEEFVKLCVSGKPAIWRSKRLLVKQVLEMDGEYDQKSATNTNLAISAELKAFISEFAGLAESDPNKTKHTKIISEQIQMATEALSMDLCFQQHLDDNPDHVRAHVCPRADVTEELERLKQEIEDKDGDNQRAVHQAGQELNLFRLLQMVGFARGKSHDGVLSGLYPHLLYQMEGTRVIATVDIVDVPT